MGPPRSNWRPGGVGSTCFCTSQSRFPSLPASWRSFSPQGVADTTQPDPLADTPHRLRRLDGVAGTPPAGAHEGGALRMLRGAVAVCRRRAMVTTLHDVLPP